MNRLNVLGAIGGIVIAALFCACSADVEPDGGFLNGGRNVSLADGYNGLYKNASVEGFTIEPWNCWDEDGPTAQFLGSIHGGIIIYPLERSCNGNPTYFGVNCARGSVDFSKVSKIVFKARGTATSELKFYASDETTENKNTINTADILKAGYNPNTWTELSFTISTTKQTIQGFVCSAGNGVKTDEWVEIKDIDWQDSNGNSVLPY